MNKAFLREPDQVDSRCPACDSVGQSVGPQTLESFLPAELRRRFAETASFCRTETCPVAHLDGDRDGLLDHWEAEGGGIDMDRDGEIDLDLFQFGARVDRAELSQPLPLKDADAPLCGCFGLTRDDIETDIREGVVTRTKAVVLKSQSDAARCTTQAPNGRSCLAEVQGYFVRCQQRGS